MLGIHLSVRLSLRFFSCLNLFQSFRSGTSDFQESRVKGGARSTGTLVFWLIVCLLAQLRLRGSEQPSRSPSFTREGRKKELLYSCMFCAGPTRATLSQIVLVCVSIYTVFPSILCCDSYTHPLIHTSLSTKAGCATRFPSCVLVEAQVRTVTRCVYAVRVFL
jgi:hypothetical protein